MNPIHKATMLKQVRKAGAWEGFVTGSKANPHSPWINPAPIRVELASMHDRPAKYVVTTNGERVELERWIHYALFNIPAELGNSVRFWEQ